MQIVTSFHPAIAPRNDQPADDKAGSHEADYRSLPSAAERLTQPVVFRSGGLNARLQEIGTALKAFYLPSIAIPFDPASGKGLREYFNERLAENVKTEQALRTVLGKVEASKVQGHLLEAEIHKLAGLALPASPETLQWMNETLKISGDLPQAPEDIRTALYPVSDSADFFKQLLAMIGFIKGEYLAIYEELLTKYSDFFREFNETIMAKMGEWITGGDDGKEVTVSFKLRAALTALRNKYQRAPDGVLYPTSDRGSATQEEAQKWAKALGLPDSCVQPDGNGGYRVMMDLSPLDAMIAEAPLFGATWDTAKFQAWQTGFNSLEGDLKNQLQLFTTKYGNANSYHENFNKILSSQLSQYAEMLKAIASGIG